MMRSAPDLPLELRRELAEVAHELADAAAATIIPYFRTAGLFAENKSCDGFDPVTVADRAGESAMRAVLARRRPKDAILGEELGEASGATGLTWVLDPIDGTRAFLSGAPTWGILVAVAAAEGPLFGVVDQPYTGERFYGGFGRAALLRKLGDTPISVRSCSDLSDAILFTTFPEIGTTIERRAFEAVRDRARLTRYGLDCYAYALVAMGQIDLVIEAGLQPYDIQGPQALIEAAGGVVTDWKGGPAHRGGQVIAAGDRRIHAQALALLGSVL